MAAPAPPATSGGGRPHGRPDGDAEGGGRPKERPSKKKRKSRASSSGSSESSGSDSSESDSDDDKCQTMAIVDALRSATEPKGVVDLASRAVNDFMKKDGRKPATTKGKAKRRRSKLREELRELGLSAATVKAISDAIKRPAHKKRKKEKAKGGGGTRCSVCETFGRTKSMWGHTDDVCWWAHPLKVLTKMTPGDALAWAERHKDDGGFGKEEYETLKGVVAAAKYV